MGRHAATSLGAAILLASVLSLGSGCSSSSSSGSRRTGALAGRTCASCHTSTVKERGKRVVHAPFRDVEGCESCHKRHGSVGTLVLKEREPKLCYSCHKEEETAFQQAHLHAPLKSG